MFKVKPDGRFRARLVTLGYRQIAGIDYTDIHAPVLNEISLRIILILTLINKWEVKKLDVEASFLARQSDPTTIVSNPTARDAETSFSIPRRSPDDPRCPA